VNGATLNHILPSFTVRINSYMKCIVYNDPATSVMCIVAPNLGYSIDDVINYCVPYGEQYAVVNDTDIPSNRTFRDFWVYDFSKNKIKTKLKGAKGLAHIMRRKARAKIFVGLDALSMNPSTRDSAEFDRYEVRECDAVYQAKIESCKTEKSLINIVSKMHSKSKGGKK